MMQSSIEESTESSADEKPSIPHVIELISSLISLSYSINVFTLKWQLILHKLEELLSSLTAMENCGTTDDPLLSSSIQAITATVEDCHDLACQCVDRSFSGKLLMKSNLDIVSKKLDNHVKSLCDIYNLRLLAHTYAIVVSRPNLGASRDDIKFYVMDLFSRLKIGSADMKKEALVAFNEVIQEDDKYIKIAVEVDRFMYLLVNFLDSQEGDIQEEAAKAVCVIAGSESCKGVLINAGIIAGLVRVLEGGSELSKQSAARCLQKLTENSDNAWSVSAHGGVTALLKICNNGGNNGGLISLACGVLKNIVGVQEIKRFVVDEDAIPSFIRLVRSKDEATQLSAIDFLRTIASGDESIRQLITKEGGVRALIRVLDTKASSSSSSSSKAREMALRGIMNLCSPNDQSLNTLMNNGFMDHMMYVLRYGEHSIQELGLKAASWLCGTSEEAKKAMGDAGFITELVSFLGSKSFDARETAAETICSMISVPRNRKRFVQNDQNVGLLLRMLDPEEANSGNKKLLLSILMSLTRSHSARKKIVNSGYLKNIEKLADEISEAKKIVRKLSTNRFSSMLTRIWS